MYIILYNKIYAEHIGKFLYKANITYVEGLEFNPKTNEIKLYYGGGKL